MTAYEIAARKKTIVDHVGVILLRHPDSPARREGIAALLDRLDLLRDLEDPNRK